MSAIWILKNYLQIEPYISDLLKKYTKYYVLREEHWNQGKDVLAIYFQLANIHIFKIASGGIAITFMIFLP